MWNKTKTKDDGKKVLDWQDFRIELPFGNESATPQIASHLRRILERFEESEFIKYLVVPSPIALSGFFHCTEQEIHDALAELQRQGYEYEATGSSGPITLWDPLIRRQASSRREPNLWQMLYESIAQPVSRPIAG